MIKTKTPPFGAHKLSMHLAVCKNLHQVRRNLGRNSPIRPPVEFTPPLPQMQDYDAQTILGKRDHAGGVPRRLLNYILGAL